MFGTTLPTDGTGLVMSGDMDGMLASWANRVTPPSLLRSPSPLSVNVIQSSVNWTHRFSQITFSLVKLHSQWYETT